MVDWNSMSYEDRLQENEKLFKKFLDDAKLSGISHLEIANLMENILRMNGFRARITTGK